METSGVLCNVRTEVEIIIRDINMRPLTFKVQYFKVTLGSFTFHFGFKYEIIYQLDAIEYLFVFFQLDMFRAYTPIFRSNGCYNFFTYALQHATSTHTPQDRHLTTPRKLFAAYVKKL